ncbi:MAG: glycoside hydrolase family 65 protein [Halanaerobiales bacterium]|nr:glycoside hydrolase family 65 protein [Halanaerobiales bacterium]
MKNHTKWSIIEEKFNPAEMGYYETIFTLGNGYLGVRGAFEENYLNRTPGNFIAGIFDQTRNQVTEIPNCPDWLEMEIELNGERFDLLRGNILDYQRTLDLKKSVLTRVVRWEDTKGKITRLKFIRFVSIKNQHLMGITLEITPENYDGEIKVVSGLNGQITNSGTQHFVSLEECAFNENGVYLLEETFESGHLLCFAATHKLSGEVKNDLMFSGSRKINYKAEFHGENGKTIRVEKLVTIYTSRDDEFKNVNSKDLKEEIKAYVFKEAERAYEVDFQRHLCAHTNQWAELWEKVDVKIDGNEFDQLAIRFAIYHLIQMASFTDPRVSVAAKGLSGEGYKGHVFWDTEIFILPFFVYSLPEVGKNLLKYRYNTLPGAMKKAKDNGYQGAMYAWESTDSGEETTPKWGALDLKTRKPTRIWCGETEQHITTDVVYAILNYYSITKDRDFLVDYGAEILFLTSRYWASRVEYNAVGDCFEIRGVIGPDEYSEFVNNNYYTNRLVQYQLIKAAQLREQLKEWNKYDQLQEKLNLLDEEFDKWLEIADKIKLNQREDGLLIQFDNFLDQKEIDVLYYRNLKGGLVGYIGWEEVTKSQVLKQADVVMLLYLLFDKYSKEIKKTNWDFYEPKTMHDSSLSAAIHSAFAAEIDLTKEAYEYFSKAANIDFSNNMGNSDHGLHAAAQGGIWQAVVHGFGGLRIVDGMLTINPKLPEQWNSLSFKINYHGVQLDIMVNHNDIKIKPLSKVEKALEIMVRREKFVLHSEEEVNYKNLP